MKKMNFNTRYGLTDATIERRKRETRRVEPICKLVDGWIALGYSRIEVVKNGKVRFYNDETGDYIEEKTQCAIGEIVAVAQSYKDAGVNPELIVSFKKDWTMIKAIQSPGWTNKMFTSADLMPHQIRITDIRIERLQDISGESCLREGIMRREMRTCPASECADTIMYDAPNMPPQKTPREAFAALIDKVSGLGTWESNPYVVVYGFELVK